MTAGTIAFNFSVLRELQLPAETASEFGEDLKRDRELREVSREQLAAATKVSLRQIEALESGKFEQLPAVVFASGFVRAIAHHLGLDAERTVTAFRHVHAHWASEYAKSRPSPGSGTHPRIRKPRRTLSSDSTVLGLGIAALLALVTGAAAFLKSRSNERPTGGPSVATVPRSESGPASLALPPAIAAATVALSPATVEATPSATSATALTSMAARPQLPAATVAAAPNVAPPVAVAPASGRKLTLTFKADCWTEVSVDGKVVAVQLFRRGDTRDFTGAHKFTLTLGDPGNVEVAVDGRALPAIGTAGKVLRNFVITDETLSRI